MNTSLSNVKVKYIRPKYLNLKEWCEDENNAYIGRKNIVFINKERYPKKDSIWANPYKVNKDSNIKEVLKNYKKYIIKKIKDENLTEELMSLKGKNLGCWCVEGTIHNLSDCDLICHGQILMKLITKYSKKQILNGCLALVVTTDTPYNEKVEYWFDTTYKGLKYYYDESWMSDINIVLIKWNEEPIYLGESFDEIKQKLKEIKFSNKLPNEISYCKSCNIFYNKNAINCSNCKSKEFLLVGYEEVECQRC